MEENIKHISPARENYESVLNSVASSFYQRNYIWLYTSHLDNTLQIKNI